MARIQFENMAALLAAGYVLYKECYCTGTLTLKYRKAGTRNEIWILPKMMGGMFKKIVDSVNVQSGKLLQLPSVL